MVSLNFTPHAYHSHSGNGARPRIAVLTYLSGDRRGSTTAMRDKTLHVDIDDQDNIKIHPADESNSPEHIATFHRSGDSYEIAAHNKQPDWAVWINGKRINSHLLKSGDLIEILNRGPLLVFQKNKDLPHQYKSIKAVFEESVADSVQQPGSFSGKSLRFTKQFVANMALQTSVWFRVIVVAALVALTLAIALTGYFSRNLERRLAQEQSQISGLAELLKQADSQSIKRDELTELRETVSKGMSTTAKRVEALETRSAAAQKIIASYTRSVVFVMGVYGYMEPETGRPLRLVIGPNGQPLRTPFGQPAITLDGDGPPLEINFSGTAFLINREGHLLSNRHVVKPWENNDANESMLELGLEPVTKRLAAYVAGDTQPLPLEVVSVSEDADVALVHTTDFERLGNPLTLSGQTVAPGNEVILLGYPTGVRALLARAGDKFVDELKSKTDMDFWKLTQQLADNKLIQPLATRGIVAQVTDDLIVYDAETAQGASGSPVLLLNGEVAAINSALLSDFGGSNLGVPVKFARSLLTQL